MNTLIIIISIIATIFIVGGIWGRVEKAQKSLRSGGVADSVLSGQFEDDMSWYRASFDTFLLMHFRSSMIDKGGAGGPGETERQRGLRVIDEQMYG